MFGCNIVVMKSCMEFLRDVLEAVESCVASIAIYIQSVGSLLAGWSETVSDAAVLFIHWFRNVRR